MHLRCGYVKGRYIFTTVCMYIICLVKIVIYWVNWYIIQPKLNNRSIQIESEIWSSKCNGKNIGLFVDVDSQTCSSHYKVPYQKSSHVSCVSRWMTLQKIGTSFIHSFNEKRIHHSLFTTFVMMMVEFFKNGHTILLNLTKIPSFTLKEGGRHFSFIAREL